MNTLSSTFLCFWLLWSIFALAPAQETRPAESTPVEEMSVVSWNIRVGVGPDRNWKGEDAPKNLQAIAEAIQKWEADIVLLQEVDRGSARTKGIDQLAILGEATGMHTAWAPAIEEETMLYGIGILSRWPIEESHAIKLPKVDYSDRDVPAWYSEQRMALVARVDAGGVPLSVVDTHMGLTKEQRLAQLKAVAEIVEREMESGRAVIAGGDLNAEPDAAELLPLRALLRDAYHDHVNEQGLAADIPIAERLTYPAVEPDRSIDYLFVSDAHFDVEEVEVPAVPLSDHLPVVAKLRVKQENP